MGAVQPDGGCVGRPGQPAGGAADRLEVAVVEVAELDAVLEQHAVALPVEAVGEDHLALVPAATPGRSTRRPHPVTDAQVELTLVGLGEGVRLPHLHRTESYGWFTPPGNRRARAPT